MLKKIIDNLEEDLQFDSVDFDVDAAHMDDSPAAAENKNAILLYEKLGFIKYGTFPNDMKYADGSYSDAYWMMKKLVSN